jgi:hypothetical protein
LGYLLPPRPELFGSTHAVFPLAASPNLVKDWVHPLVRFASTSEFVADPVPLSYLITRAPLMGFRSRSRHQHRGFIFLGKGSHPLLTFRPQRSSRSRRFTPRTTSRAYFIPKPRLRFTLQGFSLLPSRCTSSMPRSLMSLAAFAYHSPKLVTPARAAPPSGPCA